MLGTNGIVLTYVFFWVVRIQGWLRRNRQPLLRGPGFFFDVPVEAGFYEGPGRQLLRDYKLRMLIPFAVDLPCAIAIFTTGHLQWLVWLVLALTALIHINHLYSVDLAERQARRFSKHEEQAPVSAIALSLEPRRLRDYSRPGFEWTIGLLAVVALAVMAYGWPLRPGHPGWGHLFASAWFFVYLQLGFLYVKQLIVSWRSPVPRPHAEQYMALRAQTRAYYLRMCDWNRLALGCSFLLGAVMLLTSPGHSQLIEKIWIGVVVLVGIVGTVLVEIKRKRLASMTASLPPARLPNLLEGQVTVRWPICWDPCAPTPVLKGARGYSINFANTLAKVGVAYVAGFMVLIAVSKAFR